MKLSDIILDIHALNEELAAFEKKYGVLSQTFYEWYSQGEEPEDDRWVLDFSMWAGAYESWLERQKLYREAIQAQLAADNDDLQRVMQHAAALEIA